MLETTANTLYTLGGSSIFPIVEFASLFIVVIVTYLLLHKLLGHLKPATKALVALFFGTLAYSVGKIVVITFFVTPTITGYGF